MSGEWTQRVEAVILKDQIDHDFPAESAFDRSFHLDDPSQIRLGSNNNPVAAGSLGMKKKKPLYSHLHQPAVYQEHKVTFNTNKTTTVFIEYSNIPFPVDSPVEEKATDRAALTAKRERGIKASG